MHPLTVLVLIFLTLNRSNSVLALSRQYKAFVPTPANMKLNVATLTTFTSTTPLVCMWACVNNIDCLSFNMGPEGRCELLKSYLCNSTEDRVSEMGAVYYDVDVDMEDGSLNTAQWREECREKYMCSPKCEFRRVLGAACQNEADCDDVIGGTCTKGRCQCKPEFHYRKAEDSCVKDCVNYGNTFTATRGYALPEYNDVVSLSGHTFSTCMTSCLNATFICRSFEFGSSAGACLLSSQSCSNIGMDVCESNAYYDYFSRDCS